jgi:hypothetical protein
MKDCCAWCDDGDRISEGSADRSFYAGFQTRLDAPAGLSGHTSVRPPDLRDAFRTRSMFRGVAYSAEWLSTRREMVAATRRLAGRVFSWMEDPNGLS